MKQLLTLTAAFILVATTLVAEELPSDLSLLNISVSSDETEWKDMGDEDGDRKTKDTLYTIHLTNHGTNTLKDIRIEYCLYSDRKDYIQINDFKRLSVELEAGETRELEEREASFKRVSGRFLNETVGIRVRAYLPAKNGTEVMSEVCFPEPLPLEKYPWTKSTQISQENLPNPSSYPYKKLSERDVKDLARAYIKAMERKNFDAWKELLAPMHPDHPDLDENDFNRHVHRISSIEIESINGRNVVLSIRRHSRGASTGYLIIHSSGHIKYTPFVFEHPIRIATQALGPLVSDNYSFRSTSVRLLKKLKIPLFDYDINASGDDQKQTARKILDWLRGNGAEHDITEPKVRMSDAELQERITLAEYNLEHYPYSH